MPACDEPPSPDSAGHEGPDASDQPWARPGWTKTFPDPRLCAAIVDRLAFGGDIIETGTDSYRLATTRARAEERAAS
ncbi:hypothetical protein Slala03_80520 [Streptomyces lavendulae subsp. lavendulae]|nr:hypothetical protein Slala03_80520 [Streptomyces lavendulae subsp. lavendulae]